MSNLSGAWRSSLQDKTNSLALLFTAILWLVVSTEVRAQNGGVTQGVQAEELGLDEGSLSWDT